HLGREVRLPLSGAALSLAAGAARDAVVGRAARAVHLVPPEPRSGGELRAGTSGPSAHEPGAAARPDGFVAADALDADAVSGAGIRVVVAVPVFRGLRARSGRGRQERTRGVPDAVSERRRFRAARRARQAVGSGNIRALQAESEGARN